MYKNQLQELAQRSCFNLPAYSCVREGPDHAPRFKSTVNFNGEVFESPGYFSTLRQAEHAAAEVALNMLSTRGPAQSLAARVLDETGVCKNLLQETAQRAGVSLPLYTTVRSGPGHLPVFTCNVEVASMLFPGEAAKTKKQAEKNAAMAAWSALRSYVNKGNLSSSATLELLDENEQSTLVSALASGVTNNQELTALGAASASSSASISNGLALAVRHGSSSSMPRSSSNTSFGSNNSSGNSLDGLSAARLAATMGVRGSQNGPGPLYVPKHVDTQQWRGYRSSHGSPMHGGGSGSNSATNFRNPPPHLMYTQPRGVSSPAVLGGVRGGHDSMSTLSPTMGSPSDGVPRSPSMPMSSPSPPPGAVYGHSNIPIRPGSAYQPRARASNSTDVSAAGASRTAPAPAYQPRSRPSPSPSPTPLGSSMGMGLSLSGSARSSAQSNAPSRHVLDIHERDEQEWLYGNHNGGTGGTMAMPAMVPQLHPGHVSLPRDGPNSRGYMAQHGALHDNRQWLGVGPQGGHMGGMPNVMRTVVPVHAAPPQRHHIQGDSEERQAQQRVNSRESSARGEEIACLELGNLKL
eukprot:TRINITY_DN35421_c0_g1_i1.p1 TRINITY_DN35421_c0_g1~~TRINITY_DN35421_c0_g1_i1.p1  ORF type:complete len:578 (-),score=73.76 TRINITY_DN35421_c0_g1_i1:2077-3810(-)